jgi:hypothetical protein
MIMARNHQAASFILLIGTVLVVAASKPKDRALPLTPAFRQDAGGWRFVATFKSTGAADVDLPTLLQESSLVLDDKVFPRKVVRFGGRSNLSPGESWSFIVEMGEYLGWDAPLAEGRHSLRLRFGGQEFGPVDFIWMPADNRGKPR